MFETLVIEDVAIEDFPQVQEIYAHYVVNTSVTLEEVPPTISEMVERWQSSLDKNLPYLVMKSGDKVVGYAYAHLYRARSAYRFTVEESVYVDPEYKGQGIGRKLLEELISQCRQKAYRQVVAVIAGSDNIASIKFHESLGFQKAGVLKDVGFKFDKWIDSVLMQLDLSNSA